MPVWVTCKASGFRHLFFGETHASLLRQAYQAVALHTKVSLQLMSISSDAYTQLVYVLQMHTNLVNKTLAAALLTKNAYVQSDLILLLVKHVPTYVTVKRLLMIACGQHRQPSEDSAQ